MTFSIVCFIIVGFCIWGMLAKLGQKMHESLVEPLCIEYAKEGRKKIFRFLLVGIVFNSIYKALSRSPLWVLMYYIVSYLNNSNEPKTWCFVITLIVVSGLSVTADDINKHFPKPPGYKEPWWL